MPFVVASFLAGILTVAAPCILPLLPVVIGGSFNASRSAALRRALFISIGLAISVIAFTLLLKATTALLDIPSYVWQYISGGIVIVLGVQMLFPNLWLKIASKVGLESQGNQALAKASQKTGVGGALLTGAALGPVFSSCSPTYAFIVAAALPASLFTGLIYLIAYALGLSLTLLGIALLGQKLTSRLGWLSSDKGIARRVIAVLFIAVGVMVIFGLDKKLQTYILDQGLYAPIQSLEDKLRR